MGPTCKVIFGLETKIQKVYVSAPQDKECLDLIVICLPTDLKLMKELIESEVSHAEFNFWGVVAVP